MDALEARLPIRDFAYSITDGDGNTCHILINGVPVFGKNGGFLGYRGTGTDETNLTRANMELRDAKEKAEFANRSKTEFLANMSHELRTPLTIINGGSDVLIAEMFGPLGSAKYMQYANSIRDAGGHLLELIGNLLDISREEINRIELKEESFDVGMVVSACRNLIRGNALEAELELKTEVDKGAPALHADKLRIKQIILNLLSNAIKFTPEGGRVTLKTGTDDAGGIVISVEDTGIGIAAENMEKVLSTFGQVETAYIREYRGAGLGLPLSKRLVELHGGTLELESELDMGTIVTVRFPPERSVN